MFPQESLRAGDYQMNNSIVVQRVEIAKSFDEVPSHQGLVWCTDLPCSRYIITYILYTLEPHRFHS